MSITDALNYAQAQLGDPYKWGAGGPNAFDCSGLTAAAYAAAGVQLPHNAQQQYNTVSHVASPQPGDLAFFGDSPNSVTHVGIYLGNGQMIDAPHSGANVRVDSVHSNLVGFGRPEGGAAPSGGFTAAPASVASNVGGKLLDWLGVPTPSDVLHIVERLALGLLGGLLVLVGLYLTFGAGSGLASDALMAVPGVGEAAGAAKAAKAAGATRTRQASMRRQARGAGQQQEAG